MTDTDKRREKIRAALKEADEQLAAAPKTEYLWYSCYYNGDYKEPGGDLKYLLAEVDKLQAEAKAARFEAGKQELLAAFYLEGLEMSSQLNEAARELFAAFPREGPANFNIPGYLVTNLENAIKLDDEMKGRSAP